MSRVSSFTDHENAIPSELESDDRKVGISTASEQEDNPGAEEREPCPTPLEWSEILQTFVQEAEHWYLDVDGSRILGRTWGSGPSLYFLNGLAGTHELYSLMVWLLREDFRCVVFDYPNSASVTNSSIAELLPQVVNLHGHSDPVAVYCRDFGCQIARMTAEAHPGLIGALICQTPSLGLSLKGTERMIAALGKRLPFNTKRIPGRVMIQQRSHRLWFPPYDQSRFQFYLDSSGRQSISAMAQRFLLSGESIPDWTVDAAPGKFLIIRAEGESESQAAAAERCAAALPHAGTEWLHTSGQLACLTHPHRVVKLVRGFLKPSETGVS